MFGSYRALRSQSTYVLMNTYLFKSNVYIKKAILDALNILLETTEIPVAELATTKFASCPLHHVTELQHSGSKTVVSTRIDGSCEKILCQTKSPWIFSCRMLSFTGVWEGALMRLTDRNFSKRRIQSAL